MTKNRAAPARDAAWRAEGGSAGTTKAVERALAWLARHQHKDGYWDADDFGRAAGNPTEGKGGGWHGEPQPCRFDVEVTALATMAFLAMGHTHKARGPYQKHMAKALTWLSQSASGATLFGVGYATQALAEAFDLTGDEELKDAIESNVDILIDSQHPRAGWRYFAHSRMASGVPTTSAVVPALAAAQRVGIKVPKRYRKPILPWLDGLMDKKTGRVKYHVGAERLGYTPTTTNAASTLLIRAWLGETKSPRFESAVKAVMKRKPKWSIKFKEMIVKGRKRRVQIGYLQHYFWWHASDALAIAKHPVRKTWYGALKKALIPKQKKSGHLAGSWDPVGTYGKVGGRVFSTALCTLALTSPIRYADHEKKRD